MPTPWEKHRTQGPEAMRSELRDGMITIQAGTNPVDSPVCQQGTGPARLQVRSTIKAAPVAVEPFKIRLDRWRRREIPVVHMHPFGLLHLIVTQQGPLPVVLIARIMTMGRGTDRIIFPVEIDCELLRMLRVKGFMLSITTDSNLDVRVGA